VIQIDALCAYAAGATFACVSRVDSRTTTRWTAAYLGLCFVPAATFLLVAYPKWHTMRLLDHAPLGLVILAAVANLVAGIAGASFAHGRGRWVHVATPYLLASVIAIAGWDGTGYRRTLSATGAQALAIGICGAILIAGQLGIIARLRRR
jgi:hypothetical protein